LFLGFVAHHVSSVLWERDVGGKGIDLSAKIQLTIRYNPSVDPKDGHLHRAGV
jgi:hypothetical protein